MRKGVLEDQTDMVICEEQLVQGETPNFGDVTKKVVLPDKLFPGEDGVVKPFCLF